MSSHPLVWRLSVAANVPPEGSASLLGTRRDAQPTAEAAATVRGMIIRSMTTPSRASTEWSQSVIASRKRRSFGTNALIA